MATLNLLGAGQGFTAGDIETDGYLAVIPAYQKIYFADGRPYSATIGSSGYHKLDFINTRLVGTITGTFTKGETVTQATSGAKGTFDEKVTVGAATWSLIYRTTTIEFDTTHVVTGADSSATMTPTSVVAPPHWLNWKLTSGTFPDGGSNIGCMCFGRIFINSMLNPHQWWCSRVSDPLDFDTSQDDTAAATYSQNSKAGEVGDVIIAMIPYKDHYLIWGCANEMWILQSDPLMGGVNRCLSKVTGIFSPTSYCWDDKNNLYFLGTDGIYSLPSESIVNASPPENITKTRIPELVTSLGLNRRTDRVVMGYDKQRYGVQVSVTQMDGTWSVCFWIDLRTGGLFPDKFPSLQSPSSMYYFDSYKSTERGLLLGGYDGYIRKFDNTAKNDEGSNAIDSFVSFGPFLNNEEPRKTIDLSETSLTMGEDTDGITVDLHKAKSADEVIDNVIGDIAPLITKTLSDDGLENSIRDKVSDRAIVIKLSNNTISESWSMEELNIDIKVSGREK